MAQSLRGHRQTWDLIPWLLNGTASVADREAAEAHLRECAACREELQFQRSVQTAVAAQPQLEPAEGWAALQERLVNDAVLDSPRRESSRSFNGQRTARFAFTHNWWVGALAAMVVLEAWGIGALGLALWSSQPGARAPVYQTLAAKPAAAASPTIRLVLAPTMTVGELQQLLYGTGLQAVGGPTEGGVWSLAPAGTSSRAATDAEVRALRANAAIRFAEAVGSAQ